MKFYNGNNNLYYWSIISNNQLTAIHYDSYRIRFFKNGKIHNNKNASFIDNIIKAFYLNGNFYGNNTDFTKESWRRFVKLQVFS
jgi:hypothetical protein